MMESAMMSETTLQEANTTSNFSTISNDTDDDIYSDTGEVYRNPFDLTYIRVIFIMLYAIVFTCCFVGNLLVILVVLVHRKMRTITNFFLANLAVADFCVGIFCVLPNLSQYLSPYWHLGRAMCKLYYYVQTMSYTASIAILTAISIERYFAIIHPMRSKHMTTLALLRGMVILIWVMAAAYGVPFLIIYDTKTIVSPFAGEMTFCLIVHDFNLHAYITANFLVWYIVPLILMTIMYTRISIVLWRTSKQDNVSISSSALSKKFRAKAQKEKKSIKLVSFRKSVLRSNNETLYKPMTNPGGTTTATSASESETSTADSPAKLTKQNSDASTINADGASKTNFSDEENSSETLPADYEDDWPGSSHKPNMAKPKLKKITFKHPTGNIHQNGAFKTEMIVHMHQGGYSRVSKAPTPQTGRKKETALTARRKVINLLIAVIVSFAVCVLPYHIRVLWQMWCEPMPTYWQHLIPPTTFLILYLNSALNPILYAFFSDNFRRSLREVILCQHKRALRHRSNRSLTQTESLRTMHSTTSIRTMHSTGSLKTMHSVV